MNESENNKLLKLRKIRQACGLGSLSTPEQLGKYWVATDPVRTVQIGLRNSIKETLHAKTDVHILVYGHPGCGKSTELSKLVQELEEECLTVKFSILSEMDMMHPRGDDLLLVLTERLLHTARERGFAPSDSDLKSVYEYFSTVTRSTTQSRESELGMSAEAGAGTGFFDAFLKLMVGIKSEIKLNVHSTETKVAELRKRPADLVQQVNIVINAVRQKIPRHLRLLFIVEDLDKLQIANARRLFIDEVNFLTSIVADVIYTIPIFTFHCPDAASLRVNFQAFSLPMIKVVEWNKERAPGFKVIEQIVRRRVDFEAIEPDALELLIKKTGGVLQHVFEVINNATLLNNAAVPLTKANIEAALKIKRSDFWSEITLPTQIPEGVKSLDDLYDRLTEYAKRQLKGEKNPPKVDAINQILLRSCALVEYNGERWYGVHPLVIDNLRELGRID